MREKINQDAIRREQAGLLRKNGMSYRQIMDRTGLSLSVVRTLSKNIEVCETKESTDLEMPCVYCGGSMEQPECAGRPRRFCSDRCRRQYWRLHRSEQKKNPDIISIRICRYCGEPFEVYGKNDRKYCCRDHYLKHFWGDDVNLKVKTVEIESAS